MAVVSPSFHPILSHSRQHHVTHNITAPANNASPTTHICAPNLAAPFPDEVPPLLSGEDCEPADDCGDAPDEPDEPVEDVVEDEELDDEEDGEDGPTTLPGAEPAPGRLELSWANPTEGGSKRNTE